MGFKMPIGMMGYIKKGKLRETRHLPDDSAPAGN